MIVASAPSPVSISIPFALDSSGLVATEQSSVVALSQRVTALASTQPGERVMAADFGVDTASLLFNASADSILQVMGLALTAKMKHYEPGAELTSVQPLLDASGTGLVAVVATAQPVASSGSSSASAAVTVRADGTVVTLS
jgi:phage baseplate assembly protein W